MLISSIIDLVRTYTVGSLKRPLNGELNKKNRELNEKNLARERVKAQLIAI